MRRDIPRWVTASCGHWGRQKRRMWEGRDWYINAKGKRQYDIDGFAECLMGRIREERDGASQGVFNQHWAEVMWGDGLAVQRALPGIPELPHYFGHFQYVWPPEWQMTIPMKAAMIGCTKSDYYDGLELFEFWVFARLDSVSCSDAKQKHLQVVQKDPMVAPISGKMPEVPSKALDFSPMNRTKISLNR